MTNEYYTIYNVDIEVSPTNSLTNLSNRSDIPEDGWHQKQSNPLQKYFHYHSLKRLYYPIFYRQLVLEKTQSLTAFMISKVGLIVKIP